jgi:hypothetical protein
MLPKVAVGGHCCAQAIHVENYRSLVGDGLIDEILRLIRDVV